MPGSPPEAVTVRSLQAEPPGGARWRARPGRVYWYRFRAGGVQSPIGRTRTAPAIGAPLQRLRLALASCQQYMSTLITRLIGTWRQTTPI